MPWGDWQFWAVSAVAALGAWTLVKQFRPERKARGDSRCDDCPQ